MENKHFPTKEEAEALLAEAESCNPGPWGNHSRTAAHCAEAIAKRAGMDAERAYVLGLLHDIGRMTDVKNRYGAYDPEKWNKNLWLKEYFEGKMGMDLYEAVDKEHFRPQQPE